MAGGRAVLSRAGQRAEDIGAAWPAVLAAAVGAVPTTAAASPHAPYGALAMMNLACWAVPIRDGYVLRADRSTATILRAAPARSPQFWGWRIALIQPQSQQFSAPLAARAAVLAVDYVRLAGGAAPTDESPRRRRAAIWMDVALGGTNCCVRRSLGAGVGRGVVSGGAPLGAVVPANRCTGAERAGRACPIARREFRGSRRACPNRAVDA